VDVSVEVFFVDCSFGQFSRVVVLHQTFGASICIYKGFCDATFLVLGEKSESEIVLHSFGVRALKSNLQLFAINPKN
jgi:hypothetical protein